MCCSNVTLGSGSFGTVNSQCAQHPHPRRLWPIWESTQTLKSHKHTVPYISAVAKMVPEYLSLQQIYCLFHKVGLFEYERKE